MRSAVWRISGSAVLSLLSNLRRFPQMTRLTTWTTGEEGAP
jgi:hypothetical protein